jgi:hypothetical protein
MGGGAEGPPSPPQELVSIYLHKVVFVLINVSVFSLASMCIDTKSNIVTEFPLST